MSPEIINILKELASGKTILKLLSSRLGRISFRGSVSLIGKLLDIPLHARQSEQNDDQWIITAGTPEARLHVQCTIHKETLAEIAELAGTAWKEGRKLKITDLLPVIQQATNTPSSHTK